MSYSHEWLVKDYVLYSKISNPYTDDDVVGSSTDVVENFNSTSQPVFLIVNTLGITSFPKNIVRAIPSVQKFMTHANLRQLIVISDNPSIKFVSMLATQVQRNKVILHTTLDEALAYIGKQVPEIASQLTKLRD